MTLFIYIFLSYEKKLIIFQELEFLCVWYITLVFWKLPNAFLMEVLCNYCITVETKQQAKSMTFRILADFAVDMLKQDSIKANYYFD